MSKPPDLSPLLGVEVTRLCLDYAVTILLAGYDDRGEQRMDATLVI